MAVSESDRADTYVRPYSWYMLGILAFGYMINAVDRQILSILAQSVKASLSLGDAQLGFLYGTTFAVFYMLFGLAFARLADVWNRTRIISFGMAFWSVMTAMCGLAGNYPQLALARMGVGIGEASASPTAYSLIGDMFPIGRRALALSIYNVGVYIGYSIALPFGAWALYKWSRAFPDGSTPFNLKDWQGAFLFASIPGILLAAWVLTLREPKRTGQGDPAIEELKTQGPVRHFLSEAAAVLPPFTLWTTAPLPNGVRNNLTILGGTAIVSLLCALATGDFAQWATLGFGAYAVGSWAQRLRAKDEVAFAAIFQRSDMMALLIVATCVSAISTTVLFWMSPYAMRTFELPSEVVGVAIGIPSGIFSALGALLGGTLSDFARKRSRSGRLYVVMASLFISPISLTAAIFSSDFSIYLIFIMITLASNALYFASLAAQIQDILPARIRATGAATMYIAISLGIAIGPYLVGRVSQVTGSLGAGILAILVVTPIGIAFLFKVLRSPGADAALAQR